MVFLVSKNLNNDKLSTLKYTYNVELLLKMALNSYLLLIGDGIMRIVAVILVGLFSISNVYAVDDRSMNNLESNISNYIIFAEEDKPLEEEPDCE